MRVGNRPALGDQLHRFFRLIALRDQHTGAHCRAAMTSIGAMHIDFAPEEDRLQCRAGSGEQLGNWNGNERAVDGAQPEKPYRCLMWVRIGTTGKAHVDDELYAQLTQTIIITCQRRCADEQVVGDMRKIETHECNRNTGILEYFYYGPSGILCKSSSYHCEPMGAERRSARAWQSRGWWFVEITSSLRSSQ